MTKNIPNRLKAFHWLLKLKSFIEFKDKKTAYKKEQKIHNKFKKYNLGNELYKDENEVLIQYFKSYPNSTNF